MPGVLDRFAPWDTPHTSWRGGLLLSRRAGTLGMPLPTGQAEGRPLRFRVRARWIGREGLRERFQPLHGLPGSQGDGWREGASGNVVSVARVRQMRRA